MEHNFFEKIKKTGHEVKHFAMRLPSGPDFAGDKDESLALTRLRAMTELLTGKRLTIHATICEVIESAAISGYALPYPKLPSVSTKLSVERFDLRLSQKQIDILDDIKSQFKGPEGLIDPKEYYSRFEIIRELISFEAKRIDGLFRSRYHDISV